MAFSQEVERPEQKGGMKMKTKANVEVSLGYYVPFLIPGQIGEMAAGHLTAPLTVPVCYAARLALFSYSNLSLESTVLSMNKYVGTTGRLRRYSSAQPRIPVLDSTRRTDACVTANVCILPPYIP